MPISISRDGEILSMPEITEEQRNLLWETILRNYLRAHPEELLNLGKQKAGETDDSE